MSQQKSGLVPGILVGLVAMAAGAALYGLFIGNTGRQLGIITILIGALIGLGITAVKPSSPVLPPVAAAMGLVGAAGGQVVGDSILLTKDTPIGFGQALSLVVANFADIIAANPLSPVFWVIGAGAAYKFVSGRVKVAAMQPSPLAGAAPASAGGSWTPQPPQQQPPAPFPQQGQYPPQGQPPQG